MKILYCSWNENSKANCIESLKNIGHQVDEFILEYEKYDYDEQLMAGLSRMAKKFDLLFSFNYFPDISRVACELNMPYVSWVYDSPHLTLESLTVNNSCNHIFVFDKSLVERYRLEGIRTIEYMPLPAKLTRTNTYRNYEHDISFVGSIYDGDRDQYEHIMYLPEYIRGYLQGALESQHIIYGSDLIEYLVTDVICEEVQKYVKLSLGDSYRDCRNDIFRNMLRKHLTHLERVDALNKLGVRYSLDLYSEKPSIELPVKYMGYVDYNLQMPKVFETSKINLNITLRSIRSGIPLRVLDILGAGGFCLTNYQSELEEYFDNGKDIVWFEDFEQMCELAKYYLERDSERANISNQGFIKAKSCFSYERLLQNMFKKI